MKLFVLFLSLAVAIQACSDSDECDNATFVDRCIDEITLESCDPVDHDQTGFEIVQTNCPESSSGLLVCVAGPPARCDLPPESE